MAAACSHNTPKQTTPVAETPVAKAPTQPAPTKEVSPTVGVSDDLAKQCSLKLGNTASAPKFDYDTSELQAADRDVLQQIATCVTTGPLKGKKLELTGRADPRGTEEYNLGLGTRRAGSVKTYLERLGVGNTQMNQNTRGALDATGTDDASYSTDRRVDITLANG
ncbi:MAG: OmpA family protein [Kofleriaceae bacterium]